MSQLKVNFLVLKDDILVHIGIFFVVKKILPKSAVVARMTMPHSEATFLLNQTLQ